MNLPIVIDKQNGVPIYIQIEERIRLLVHQGILKAGDAMPTVRSLAVDLGVNANTVARVYRDLQTQGLLRLERGVGTFVTEKAGKPIPRREFQALLRKLAEVIRVAIRLEMKAPELSQLIETQWKEAEDADR